MGKISSSVKKWRRAQPKHSIMTPATFKKIESKAASSGATNPRKVAGAAYWRTVKSKARRMKGRR